MPISFFGVGTNPIDGGSLTTVSNITVTFPSGIQNGDLVLFYVYYRGAQPSASQGFYYLTSGGTGVKNMQTLGTFAFSTNQSATLFFGQYISTQYGASISASTQAAGGGNTCCGGQVLVFRPTSSLYKFKYFTRVTTAGSGNATIPSTSNIPANSVAIAVWQSEDDNTWGSIGGTGWSKTGLSAQYRNIGGSDFSTAYGYSLLPSGGSDTITSMSQLTLGPDPTYATKFIFTEYLGDDMNADFINFFNNN